MRQLAELTAPASPRPATRRQASAEIERLKQRSRSTRIERREDRQAVSRRFAERQPASTVRPEELSGHGGNAA